MNLEKVLVIHKRTAYEVYCEKERDTRILRLVAENHFTIQELRKSHTEHREAMERVGAALDKLGLKVTWIRRAELREPGREGHDLVISVGGDGTFLEASHYVRDTPMLGVNSAPSFNAGNLCPATAKNVEKVLNSLRRGTLKPHVLNRLGLVLNGSVIAEPVLNEVLVAAQSPAQTSSYIVEFGKRKEDQRSSGLYVGTAAGSMAVMRSAGSKLLPLGSKQVQYLVREPYRSGGRKAHFSRGTVTSRAPLKIHSKMRNGMIFVDGFHVRYRFDYGDTLGIILQHLPLTVYGLKPKKS